MKSNLFFIIGIRRSGTSILRELILKHPQVAGCEFEPHDLWAAVDLNHFPRLMLKGGVQTFVCDTINYFKSEGERAANFGKWHGAKFALNPGVKALEWVWLKKTFPDAKFIWIIRSPHATWNSYVKQDKDSERGIISKTAYHEEVNNLMHNKKRIDSGITIRYEDLLTNPTLTIDSVYNHLGLKTPKTDFTQFIKQPEF